MSAVDTAVTEIAKAQADMAPAHEGYRDLSRLQLSSEAATVLNNAIESYNRRQGLMEAARVALDALQQDGYPTLPRPVVDPKILEEMQDQARTIGAALETFGADVKASTLGLSGGEKKPK